MKRYKWRLRLSDSDAKGNAALTGVGTPNQLLEYVRAGMVGGLHW